MPQNELLPTDIKRLIYSDGVSPALIDLLKDAFDRGALRIDPQGNLWIGDRKERRIGQARFWPPPRVRHGVNCDCPPNQEILEGLPPCRAYMKG